MSAGGATAVGGSRVSTCSWGAGLGLPRSGSSGGE